MKKKKLLQIIVTVIWAALLVLLAVFQMPYEVDRMLVRYESETPLDASQMTFRYESDGGLSAWITAAALTTSPLPQWNFTRVTGCCIPSRGKSCGRCFPPMNRSK